MDTLAFDYAIPAIRACSGLSPVRQCSCRAYQTPTSTHSYGEGGGGGELMGLRTMVKKGNFSARLSAQNLEKILQKRLF